MPQLTLFLASRTHLPSISSPSSLYIHSLIQSLASRNLSHKDRALELMEIMQSTLFWCKGEKCCADCVSDLLGDAQPARGQVGTGPRVPSESQVIQDLVLQSSEDVATPHNLHSSHTIPFTTSSSRFTCLCTCLLL